MLTTINVISQEEVINVTEISRRCISDQENIFRFKEALCTNQDKPTGGGTPVVYFIKIEVSLELRLSSTLLHVLASKPLSLPQCTNQYVRSTC
jgi:hypothetical protein